MQFVAFNISDCLAPQKDNIPKVSMRMIEAINIIEAKILVRTYPGEWTVISNDVFEEGRAGTVQNPMADLKGCIEFYGAETTLH